MRSKREAVDRLEKAPLMVVSVIRVIILVAVAVLVVRALFF